MQTETTPPILELKKEANRIKKESNGEFTHAECLDIVARKIGYKAWNVLACSINASNFDALIQQNGPSNEE